MATGRHPRRPAGRTIPWRWGIVLTGIAALVALPSIVAAWPVDDPDVDLATVIHRIETSDSVAHVGLFESRGGVRVPDLGRYDDEVEPFTTTTRVRVWFAAPDRWRADELTAGGETGWYREPGGLWRWATGRQRVVFATRDESSDEPARFPRPMDLSPAELGRRVLGDADELGLAVSRIGPQRVAGRSAVGVRVAPTDPSSTTISRIDLWAEPETGLVLRVEIHTGGATPVFESAFLDLRRGEPDPDVLSFDPDETDVVYRTTSQMDALETVDGVSFVTLPDVLGGLAVRDADDTGVRTYGEGLGIVTVFAVPNGVLGRRLDALPSTDRPWGGTAVLIEADLVNLELIRTGGVTYVVAGTVPVATIDAVAATLAGTEAEA